MPKTVNTRPKPRNRQPRQKQRSQQTSKSVPPRQQMSKSRRPPPTPVRLQPPKPLARQTERLQKILSRAGIASRRKAEELIQAGKVRVNGQVVTRMGTTANPRTDRITVDGRQLPPPTEPVYILLNKPVGVVTTLSDPEGRPTVRELLSDVRGRVFPVGRLDFHSSGLLLLTNDGELALRLTHPRYGVRKTYRVKVKGTPTADTVAQLARGVRLDEGVTAPAEVRVERTGEGKTWLELIIREGHNREVRRMCEAVGHPVEKLTRVHLGPLSLGKLAPGQHRHLTDREIYELQRATGLEPLHPVPDRRRSEVR